MIETGWRLDAACRDTPTGEFYNYEQLPNGEPAPEILAPCGACRVASLCLEYAVNYEEHGLWAGTTARERVVLRSITGIRLRKQYER